MQRFAVAVALAVFISVLPATVGATARKGQPVPQFRVVSTTGQQITQQNYKGHLLLVEFFATWCTPCRESIPHLVGFNRKYGQRGLSILGVSMDGDDEKAVREFVTERKITYPVTSLGEEIGVAFGVRSVPTLFLINKEGVVVEKFSGFNEQTAQRIDSIINKLLSE